jgi:hypothetical protein
MIFTASRLNIEFRKRYGWPSRSGTRFFADVFNDRRHLDEIRRLTAGNSEAFLLMEQLIGRKRALFADDERLIGNWEVTRTEPLRSH